MSLVAAKRAPSRRLHRMVRGAGLSVAAAVAQRRSVRAFLPDPVDPAVAERALRRAARAPSGSNMLVTLTVRTRNMRAGDNYVGKLSMVDLAGSERLAKSQMTGQAQKETMAINKSLSALGTVIAALASGERLFTQVYIEVYNIVFTALPIILFCVFDQDVDKAVEACKRASARSTAHTSSTESSPKRAHHSLSRNWCR